MKKALISKLVAIMAFAVSVPFGAKAELNLPMLLPDMASFGISASYDAGTQLFTAEGLPLQLNLPPSYTVNPGVFQISAVIDNAGTAQNGTLSITGGVSDLSIPDGSTLLTGHLARFAFSGSGDTTTFEFLFKVTGGVLGNDFGRDAGVLLTGNFGFPGNFQNDFQSDSNTVARSDTFRTVAVPPALALMIAPGLVALAALRRRRPRLGGLQA